VSKSTSEEKYLVFRKKTFSSHSGGQKGCPGVGERGKKRERRGGKVPGPKKKYVSRQGLRRKNAQTSLSEREKNFHLKGEKRRRLSPGGEKKEIMEAGLSRETGGRRNMEKGPL